MENTSLLLYEGSHEGVQLSKSKIDILNQEKEKSV
jgi:hypothetical protein